LVREAFALVGAEELEVERRIHALVAADFETVAIE
jgi:hypothetical protein